MHAYICPFCSVAMADDFNTHRTYFPCFETPNSSSGFKTTDSNPYIASTIQIDFYKCPNCKEYSITAKGIGNSVSHHTTYIHPLSSAKKFPDYIPLAIRNDYEEAAAIVHLSPKSSATLLRRCLQGMIRDFWKIDKQNLSKAIDELKFKVSPQQWQVIDGIRRIGNIGAHMEKDINLIIDIEPDEAKKLIQLIELLIEQWYINRHEQEMLYNDILNIDKEKQKLRKE